MKNPTVFQHIMCLKDVKESIVVFNSAEFKVVKVVEHRLKRQLQMRPSYFPKNS